MTRSILRLAAAVAALATFAAFASPARVVASASPNAVAVLDREAQFLAAVSRSDAKALDTILAENYVHTTYQGKIEYREDALKNVGAHADYTQKTSGQTVDFAGDVAVVHGVNTVTQGAKVVLRLRYTDVYVKQGGAWKVLSAQETKIV